MKRTPRPLYSAVQARVSDASAALVAPHLAARVVPRPRQAGRRQGREVTRPATVLLYDGAGIGAWMDRDPSAETAARTIAAALVDVAIPA